MSLNGRAAFSIPVEEKKQKLKNNRIQQILSINHLYSVHNELDKKNLIK